jgi:amino acid adenylation domain-containing protein
MRSSELTRQDATLSSTRRLSESQQRLWVLEGLHPRNPAQNVSFGMRLCGALTTERFGEAWNEVVEQHEILRTEFQVSEGTPQPVVRRFVAGQLVAIEVEGSWAQERESKLLRLAREEARRPFDLARGPLFRAFLWRLAPQEHLFLVVAHRIVCDQASLRVLMQQLAFRYSGKAAPKEHQIPTQYGELASRRHASGEDLAYWERQLSGLPASLDLPTDRPRPSEPTFAGGSVPFLISDPVLQQLRNLAKAQGTTLFATLLAAFSVLLSRYSRQEDIVVGTPVSGRGTPEMESLVGPFENWIALRANLSGDPSFEQLTRRVHGIVDEGFRHQDVRFETVLDQLPLELDLSRSPLFQAAFSLRNPFPAIAWGDGIGAPFQPDCAVERFDLSLDLMESASVIEGKLGFNSDVFEAGTISHMAEHYCTLLAGAANESTRKVFEISFLDVAERNKLLLEFNDTRTSHRRDWCLQDFFEAQVERTPDAIAVVWDRERVTYIELNERANRVAHYLRTQGVGPETLVGICVERSTEMLVGVLGILKAGGAYLPLDPAYPKARTAAILEDGKATIVITQRRLVDTLPDSGSSLILLDEDWPKIEPARKTNPVRNVGPNNLAYVLFTSGSTGRPKGVALEHRSAAIFVQWAQEVFLPEELSGTLFSTSLCFDLSVFEIFVPLCSGGKVIIAPNAIALPGLSAAEEVTLINTVPSAIAELIRSRDVPDSVQVVNLAGEALTARLAQEVYESSRVGKVYNLYGPTEDTTYSTYTLVPRGGQVTIGRPLPNTQVYILDEKGQPVPIGVPGELHLAGEGLARGYFGREDLTKQRFVPNPFANEPGARMYRTGDLARFQADGSIQYLGRIDNQVKVRGFRIELGEIEAVLTQQPSVQSAVVIAREDNPGDKRLVGYVVAPGGGVSAQVLQDAIRQRLPEYMVPSAIVMLDALPLSPNGKINRSALPAPDSTAQGLTAVPPRNEMESILVRIWQDVLRVKDIGVRDNFFDLGGHSLKAARVLAEVQHETGKELPLSALFRGATVESLARLIKEQVNGDDPIVATIQSGDGSRPAFFAIVPPGEESLGYAMLARHMGTSQTVYKIQGHGPIVGGKRPYSADEMNTIAEEYVLAVRSVQPHGPYSVGGLCDGTHIAEQVILRLESLGEEVALFAIFDTWVLQHSQIRWLWKLHYYRERLQKIGDLKLSSRLVSYKQVAERKLNHARGKNAPRNDWSAAYWPENFVPRQFRAPVLLFKRPRQQFYYIKDSQMGWGQRSRGGVEVHEIDFHHLEILREPHVQRFGEILADRIARIGQALPRAQQLRGQEHTPVADR